MTRKHVVFKEIKNLPCGAILYYTESEHLPKILRGAVRIYKGYVEEYGSYTIYFTNGHFMIINENGCYPYEHYPVFSRFEIGGEINDYRCYCYWHPDVRTVSFESFRYCPICKR